MPDDSNETLRLFIAEDEVPGDRPRQPGAFLFVAGESDPSIVDRCGRRFSGIMVERGQEQDAAGRPGELKAVCPQRFAAPLAPHLAAKEERKEIDSKLLRHGIDYWRQRSDVVIVEGAGGLMSPIGDHDYVADLATEFAFPLVVVAPNRIGAINSTLLTLITAASRPQPLSIAGIVLNDVLPPDAGDPATRSNRVELELRCVPPVLTHLSHNAADFDTPVDWLALARPTGSS